MSSMLTEKERERAIERLTLTRQTLLDAVAGVTETQARWKPAPDRWSILEYVEHLAISDDGLVAMIKRSLETPARPESVEERKARERDEIAARVAAFRATQEKFKREREEFCVSTLENARKVERPSLWP